MATAVPPERDAVAAAFAVPAHEAALPGAFLLTPPPRPAPSGPPVRWDLVAAGVGPARAAATTGAVLAAAALGGAPYSLVVSAGIGGGFAPDAPVGSLVVADAITAADLGAETADGFVPVTDLGFGTIMHPAPRTLVRAVARATGAATGTVLTVSTVTGTAARAARLRDRHPRAVAEAMEGFGVAEAAAAHGVPALEVRAISNAVGPRDRAAWRIGEALGVLTEAFGRLGPVLEGELRSHAAERARRATDTTGTEGRTTA